MYPPAARLDLVEEVHGQPVADPYRWLERAGDPWEAQWSAAQDVLFGAAQATWTARPWLRRRIDELAHLPEDGLPVWRRGRIFRWTRPARAEHGRLVTGEGDGPSRVVIDPAALDPTGATTLDAWEPSPDGARLAYQLSINGTESSQLWVIDVAAGDVVDGPIDRVRYSPVAWLRDGTAFYYVRHLSPAEVDDQATLHRRLYLHRVGTGPDQDTLVFGHGSPLGAIICPRISADGQWLTVTSRVGTSPGNDVWLADLSRSDPERPEWRPVQVGIDARTVPDVRAGVLYLLTDREAPRGRLCACLTDDVDYGSWRELIAEDPVAVLDSYVVLDGAEIIRPMIVVLRRRHAVSELSRHDQSTGVRLGSVQLPGAGTVDGLAARPAGGREAWFRYCDVVTPPVVYRLDGRTGGTVMDGPTAPAQVAATRLRAATCTSSDGTPVNLFLVSRADQPSGPAPTLLSGYGGFGQSMVPTYDPAMAAWVDAGGVYAVAQVRGGGEEGGLWHRAGTLGGRQNAFDDFHAACRWLVESGVTQPSMLALHGSSNGGLLVGAMITQHPECCTAAVCGKPLLDMLRYERFGLGPTWTSEYGSAADPGQFAWLAAYSPYHHVRPGTHYPAVLLTVFDGDTRVDPMHARKMTAALQHATTGPGLVLLRREAGVGHGARAVSRWVDLHADELAFVAAQTGLRPRS